MSSKYDEDVCENPFFCKISSEYAEYITTLINFKGILCVPKFTIAANISLTKQDVEDHILLPTKEVVDDNDDFKTCSGKGAQILDGNIITKEGFDAARKVTILFAETFHGENGGSYRVFCVGGLLNRETDKTTEPLPGKHASPTSYNEVMDILWSHSGGQKMRDSLDKILNTFASTYDRLEGESLRSIMDAANTHFTKAMQLLLRDTVVKKSARHNHHYMENLKIAVETYMMNAVHKRLFRVITATVAAQDAELNKITRNLIDLQLSDLGIRKIFSQNILPAKKELSSLNRYSTPMGRLFCIKRVVGALTRPPKSLTIDNVKDSVIMMTSDDLLPILIFLIIKSEIPNWMANLVYMRHFHFAKSSDDDEFGFYLASIEAALEHIRTGNIKDDTIDVNPLKRERWNSLLLTEPTDALTTSTSAPTTSTSAPPATRQTSQNTIIDDFFKLVQDGDEKRVFEMLEQPHKTSEEINLKLCHPLCSCDRCDKMQSAQRINSNLVTAYTRDNRGYTALHIAAYYGQAQLIDILIKHNAVVDTTDYLGLTPLHLACQRGYQNVMLLLLHFGADVMMSDNEGNTPLHLSCANGHEDCVKALVFYDAYLKKLNINAVNEAGDTPLHLAAKWGYENIVRTLLENGANATITNRKKQTPVSLAQNVIVQRWLQLAADGLDFQPNIYQFTSPKVRSRSSSVSSTSTAASSFSNRHSAELSALEQDSASLQVASISLDDGSEAEKRRRREKLFKAIIEGDIQLVKFYFGIQPDVYDQYDDDDIESAPATASVNDMCHPLCQCDKCLGIQKATRKSGESLSVDVRTSTGYSPIHMAVLHSHSDIVALLIALNANISTQNHKSLTPLHLACCMRNSLITDMLVKAGAKLDVQDINGDTPLLIASSNGFLNGVQILIKAGANPDVTNIKGNTALHEALLRNNTDITNALLHAGGDTRIKNKQGRLPVDETQDQAMKSILMAATYRLDERDAKVHNSNNNELQNQADHKDKKNQITIKELFAAFEEKDLHTLRSLTESIRTFDPKASLRRTITRDKSLPRLDGIARRYSILSFNRGSLRKVRSVDKADPLHIYSLFQTQSSQDSANGDSGVRDLEELLTPMGDNHFLSEFESLGQSASAESIGQYASVESLGQSTSAESLGQSDTVEKFDEVFQADDAVRMDVGGCEDKPSHSESFENEILKSEVVFHRDENIQLKSSTVGKCEGDVTPVDLVTDCPSEDVVMPVDLVTNGPSEDVVTPVDLVTNGPSEDDVTPIDLVTNGPSEGDVTPVELVTNGPSEGDVTPVDLVTNGPSVNDVTLVDLVTNGPSEDDVTEVDLVTNGPSEDDVTEVDLVTNSPSEDVTPVDLITNGPSEGDVTPVDLVTNGPSEGDVTPVDLLTNGPCEGDVIPVDLVTKNFTEEETYRESHKQTDPTVFGTSNMRESDTAWNNIQLSPGMRNSGGSNPGDLEPVHQMKDCTQDMSSIGDSSELGDVRNVDSGADLTGRNDNNPGGYKSKRLNSEDYLSNGTNIGSGGTVPRICSEVFESRHGDSEQGIQVSQNTTVDRTCDQPLVSHDLPGVSHDQLGVSHDQLGVSEYPSQEVISHDRTVGTGQTDPTLEKTKTLVEAYRPIDVTAELAAENKVMDGARFAAGSGARIICDPDSFFDDSESETFSNDEDDESRTMGGNLPR